MRVFELRREVRGKEDRRRFAIDLEGSTIRLRWGLVSERGQTRDVRRTSARAAQTEYDRIVGFRTEEGYRELPTGSWPLPSESAARPSREPIDAGPQANDWVRRLEAVLRRQRPGYLKALNPGVSPQALNKLQREVGTPLPAMFRALYCWRNGADPDDAEPFLGNNQWIPLDDVRSERSENNEMLGYDFDRENWWHERWIPFLTNGSGDSVCVDLEGTFGGAPGQIVQFWHDDEQRSIDFPSMQAWLAFTVETLEAGFGSLDPRSGNFELGWPQGDARGDALVTRWRSGHPVRHRAR